MDNREVFVVCLGKQFAFAQMQQQLLSQYRSALYRNVLYLEWRDGEVFVFDYGVAVFWGLSYDERAAVQDKLLDYAQEPLSQPVEDSFEYELGCGDTSLRNDLIRVEDDELMSRLAISHGLAQSVKLGQFESEVQQTIQQTEHIPANIARVGDTQMNRGDIAKMRGRLFMTKSNIVLQYDLLDVPDFFWEYPELQHLYDKVVLYLELRQRLDVLNKRLETIHELFEMMADEQKHKHSAMLEWIIIWLIAIDIVLIMLHDIFKLF
ncbi:MAG: RMD1 family protein [Gammaproteobacteria bacterium]|nr:RMD1 family protein [Gammaproteobacteria bacterium]